MHRRGVLRLATLPFCLGIAGCSSYVHRVRGVETPMTLIVENMTGQSQTITVEIERDDESVFHGTIAFDRHGRVESVDGDHSEEAKFYEAGTYRVTAEANGYREQSTFDVTWQQLADCNSNTIEVLLHEDEIRLGLIRTDMDCPFPDTL